MTRIPDNCWLCFGLSRAKLPTTYGENMQDNQTGILHPSNYSGRSYLGHLLSSEVELNRLSVSWAVNVNVVLWVILIFPDQSCFQPTHLIGLTMNQHL